MVNPRTRGRRSCFWYSRTGGVVGDYVSRSLGFALAWRRSSRLTLVRLAFLGIDVRVAGFLEIDVPVARIATPTSIRGQKTTPTSKSWNTCHANVNLRERVPRQRRSHGTSRETGRTVSSMPRTFVALWNKPTNAGPCTAADAQVFGTEP